MSVASPDSRNDPELCLDGLCGLQRAITRRAGLGIRSGSIGSFLIQVAALDFCCLTRTDSATTARCAARTGEPGDGRQDAKNQDGQIAHGPIVTRLRNPRNATELGIRHAQAHEATKIAREVINALDDADDFHQCCLVA